MITQDQYNQLVEKIVEAVPEIMETKRGCFIRIEGAEPLIVVSENASPPAVVYGNSVFTPELDFEIIGRPIQLADVMRALGRRACYSPNYVASEKDILLIMHTHYTHPRAEWDLSVPLHLQSDDVKEFLYNLIIKV